MSIRANQNMLDIPANYLFRDIGKSVSAYLAAHPCAKIIRLGIGDAVLPISGMVAWAGADSFTESIRGRNPGYPGDADSLRNKISNLFYPGTISPEFIHVSTGAKEDSANIGEIFSLDTKVLMSDPVYPVYMSSNIMAGRKNIKLLPANAENNFLPEIPWKEDESAMIYLCFPNNPTGQVADRFYLEEWVAYAQRTGSVVLYDAAYRAFIQNDKIPKSIFEIDGAQDVAIEFCSFSKSHGFTGLRVAWTAFGENLFLEDEKGEKQSANMLWGKRQGYKTNGVAYPLIAAAEAALSDDGISECEAQVRVYMENAKMIRECFQNIGLSCIGGINSPYIWAKTPKGMSSWDFFHHLLNEVQVVCTPGSGFGNNGEGYFRLSAFGFSEDVSEALQRISSLKF